MYGYITTPAGPPSMSVIGSNLGVTASPLASTPIALIRPSLTGPTTYEMVYANLGPTGQPQSVVYDGAWGALVPAGRTR